VKTVGQDWIPRMQQEWNQRAKDNAQFFICTDVAEEEFLASGQNDYDLHVRPFLTAAGWDVHDKVALEIGCGIGRMTRCFAAEFSQVIGLDISSAMIERAQRAAPSGAKFLVGTGCDLAGIPDQSVDFVFSYIVFQHIPDKETILRYIQETGRVLRPGGYFRFQLNGLPHLALGGVLLEGYISRSPRLRRMGLSWLPLIRRRRLDSWLGHPVSLGEVRRACARSGLNLLPVSGRWTEDMWISGSLSTKAAAI
jgi:SAM-dependent methyltransferase